MTRPVDAPRAPAVIGHRGASGYALENSRAAFRRAVELGADGIELDIHATTDGALVVHHDAELPGLGPITALTGVEATGARLTNGEPVPLLEEVLDLVPGLAVWVELKSLPAVHDRRLLAILDGGPTPERYAVHAFDHRIIVRLGRLRPALGRGILLASRPIEILPLLEAASAGTLWLDWHFIDRELVRSLHDHGARVIVWTVNGDEEMRTLTEIGVDGLCGNYPDRLRAGVAPAGA